MAAIFPIRKIRRTPRSQCEGEFRRRSVAGVCPALCVVVQNRLTAAPRLDIRCNTTWAIISLAGSCLACAALSRLEIMAMVSAIALHCHLFRDQARPVRHSFLAVIASGSGAALEYQRRWVVPGC